MVSVISSLSLHSDLTDLLRMVSHGGNKKKEVDRKVLIPDSKPKPAPHHYHNHERRVDLLL